MALSYQFFSFIAQQNNNEVWLRPQLNGNSETVSLNPLVRFLPSLKNINGILVRWVVSLDAAKSKQCLDASVSKIQNVLEHCFQALFKLCFTNWSMSQQGHVPTTHQESPRRKLVRIHSHHTSWGGLNVYTQHKLLCFGLFRFVNE